MKELLAELFDRYHQDVYTYLYSLCHDLYASQFTGLQAPDLPGEVEQAVHELLSSESELTRRVFRMRLEGYSYYEIASEAGISESSARVVFFRVKTKLKQYLEKEGLYHDPDHL